MLAGMVVDLSGYGLGLTTEAQRRVHKLLNDYDANLSLRRIPEQDPAFTPGKPFGVYEEGTLGVTPWVFTLAEYAIDERVLARIAQGDMAKRGVTDGMARLQSNALAAKAMQARRDAEAEQERTEEMMSVGALGERYSRFTLRDKNGERMVVDGGRFVHTGRTYV